MTHISQLPADPAFNQNPYPFYAARHAEQPLFYWQEYGHWCAASHEDIFALLRDKRFGREVEHVASRAELGWPPHPEHVQPFYEFDRHSLLEREPPVHTRLRGLINRAFVSRQIERLRPRITSLAHELIDGFERQGEVDLLPAYCTPIPMVIITDMLGVPYADADQMLKWSHQMVGMYQFNRTRAIEDAAVQATQEFSAYIRAFVEARRGMLEHQAESETQLDRSEPLSSSMMLPEKSATFRHHALGNDILSTLIAAEEGGERLSSDELVTTAILILNAGHEATVHAIGNAAKALIEHQVDLTTAFSSVEATAQTVEEALRIDPPLHMFTRYALENLTYKGVDFKIGDKIGLLLAAANHDPKRYNEPQRFIANRQEAGHVSFGGGIHFCIGAPLARLELQIALPILFERLPKLTLAKPALYADTYHFHGLTGLTVRW